MLIVTSIAGNIFRDKEYESLEDYERLQLSRTELEKVRMRKKTDRGTDVGLDLEPGKSLRHGDVLASSARIVIEQLPEKVISVKITGDGQELPVIIGHIIGNRHRPVSVKDGSVYFPIQADSELEVFETLFAGIKAEIGIKEMVFTPHKGLDVYDHG